MSDRSCNKCEYDAALPRWKCEGKVEKRIEHGGTAIYVNGKFRVWYMELPTECAC